MTYGEGLATLRHLLAQWGFLSPEQVQNCTLHSCKTTCCRGPTGFPSAKICIAGWLAAVLPAASGWPGAPKRASFTRTLGTFRGGPSASEPAVAATLSVPEPPVELPLHSTGDLEDPEEMPFVVTARTIHKAIECTEFERCTTFQGVHLKPAFGCVVSTFQVVHFAPAGKNFCKHKACLEF